MRKTFIQAVIDNEASLDDITAYRHDWAQYKHDSDNIPCYAYLGMTLHEYTACVGGGDRKALAEIIDRRRNVLAVA